MGKIRHCFKSCTRQQPYTVTDARDTEMNKASTLLSKKVFHLEEKQFKHDKHNKKRNA